MTIMISFPKEKPNQVGCPLDVTPRSAKCQHQLGSMSPLIFYPIYQQQMGWIRPSKALPLFLLIKLLCSNIKPSSLVRPKIIIWDVVLGKNFLMFVIATM